MGIAALEDKIVQQAVVTILNQIYEVDFQGFSYGFRPGRSPHQALDALTVGIQRKHVNWVLDADIRGFFDNMSHEWTMKFVEHRVADPVAGKEQRFTAASSVSTFERESGRRHADSNERDHGRRTRIGAKLGAEIGAEIEKEHPEYIKAKPEKQ